MALKDLLTLASVVSVIRTISKNDGMGGFIISPTVSIIPLCALWQNGSSNRFLSDKYRKISTHTLCYEYGGYTFDTSASTDTAIETISYNSETYKRVGYPDDCMQLHEIMVQALERMS